MKSFILASIFLTFASYSYAQSAASDSMRVIDVSNAPLDQDNPSVTISRTNRSMIVIGASSDFDDMAANGMTAYTSTDKGLSWLSSRLPLPINPNFSVYGEPATAADDAGNFYYAYVTYDTTNSMGNISIASSKDGKSWKNVTPINNNLVNAGFPDGVYIAVDNSPSSPKYGRVYAVWDQFFNNDSLLFLQEGVTIAWSDNQGAKWSTPKFLGASDDYQMCKIGKNGEIYVSSSDSAGLGHGLFVSTDEGTTFTDPAQTISAGFFNSYPWFPDTVYTGLKGVQGVAAYPYISFDVDLTANRIHAVFGDYVGGVAIQYYSYSDNNGADWSSPQIIGSADSSDRFDPWVSVDQKTGEASVLYYASDSDPKNVLIAPYRLRLADPITSEPQMLSASYDPLIVEKTDSTTPYIGDHTMSDAFDSVYVGVWTQNREGFIDGDIFAYISFPAPQKSSVQMPVVIHSSKPWLSSPYPNPSDGKSISLGLYVPHATQLTLDLFDATGKAIKHLSDKLITQEESFTETFSLGNIPAGSYIIRMVTDDAQVSQKLVVISQ